LGGLALGFCRWAPPPNEHEDNITWCSHDSNVIFSLRLTLCVRVRAYKKQRTACSLLGRVLSFYRMKFCRPPLQKCTYPHSLCTTLYSLTHSLRPPIYSSSVLAAAQKRACGERITKHDSLRAECCEIDVFCLPVCAHVITMLGRLAMAKSHGFLGAWESLSLISEIRTR
jgi:hypothetical protein